MNAFATVIYLIVRLKIVLLRVSIATDSLASGIAVLIIASGIEDTRTPFGRKEPQYFGKGASINGEFNVTSFGERVREIEGRG